MGEYTPGAIQVALSIDLPCGCVLRFGARNRGDGNARQEAATATDVVRAMLDAAAAFTQCYEQSLQAHACPSPPENPQ